MLYTAICNTPWMFIYVIVLLVLIILQSVIFMKRAWKHALSIGLEPKQIKKGLKTGISISILPAIPVIIVLFTLIPLLGTPLSWIRLSVVGSAHYEAFAASTAIESVGESMMLNGYTIAGWIAAIWVMTLGASASILWTSAMLRPIDALYKKAEALDIRLVLAIGGGCLVGVMAYVSVLNGFSKMSTKGVIFLISFLVGAILVFIKNKIPKAKWLSDYIMVISMLVAMVVACFIF